MELFPGYVEITCPFCDRHRHVRSEELDAWRRRSLPGLPHSVVCGDCWRLVRRFAKRAIAQRGR